MRGKKVRRPGLGVVDIRRKPVTCAPPTQSIRQVFETLEPRVLLSASTVGDELIQPISASAAEVLANVAGDEVIYQEQTQYDNFFKPNVIAFDFAVDANAVNGVIDIRALSDLDHPSESVAYNIEGIVTGELWTGTDDGVRPFTAMINLNDADLAAIAADGNLHIEFTPNSNVDDFQNVDEYVTVGLVYIIRRNTISLSYDPESLAGSYTGSTIGDLSTASDTQEYILDLEAGQTLTLTAEPNSGLLLSLQLIDPDGTTIYSDDATAFYQTILGQSIVASTDGRYTLRVGTNGSIGGRFVLSAYVNEAIEEESVEGPNNNNLANAQSLDPLFRELGPGLEQTSVRGSIQNASTAGASPDVVIAESFEGGVLPPGWSINVPYGGRVHVTDTEGASDGDYALMLDSINNVEAERLNKEAIWTVDLTDNQYWTLSFDYIDWLDYEHPLPTIFTGSHIGDGVSISADGINWHRVFNPPERPNGVWDSMTIDLSTAADAAGITLGPGVQIKFQQYDQYASNAHRRGFDNIKLSANNTPPSIQAYPDFYKFTLDADEFASFRLASRVPHKFISFNLYDPNGDLLYASSYGLSATLSDFKAPIAGEYAVEIDLGDGSYNLSVFKGGGYGNTNASSERFGRTGVSSSTPPNTLGNQYSISARAGDVLTFQTSTPDDGFSGLNTLDPYLRLYRQSTLFASDLNSAPDGRNARITYTVPQDGTYYVEVLPTSGQGNYILTGSGYTGTNTNDRVTIRRSNIEDYGYSFNFMPEYISLELNNAPLPSSLQASDLLINGIPATSFGVQASDNSLVMFYLPKEAINVGQNIATIAAGAFRDTNGNINDGITIPFTVDLVPPTIIASSVSVGDILAPGDITVRLEFSEPITPRNVLPIGYHARINSRSGLSNPDFFHYDDTTNGLTLIYEGLGEGSYTVTIDDRFGWDAAGNGIDGEANPDTTVPTGDGIEGGDFELDFAIEDHSVIPLEFSTNLSVPVHSYSASSSFTGRLDYRGDEDRYTFDLKAGQTVSAGLVTINDYRGDYVLDITFELFDPSGNLVSTSSGRYPVIESVAVTESGTYTLLTRTEETSNIPPHYGFDYTGVVLLNAVMEGEVVDGLTNDTLGSAKNISSAFTPLGDGVKQTVIVGDLTPAFTESFDLWPLGPSWSTGSYGPIEPAGYIRPSASPGQSYPNLGMLMIKNGSVPGYVLNEAILTVDLSGVTDATLSFSVYSYNDDEHVLPASFTGHYDGDGVAISDDGVNWHTLLTNLPHTYNQWLDYSFDLAQAANDAGMTLGPDFKIKLQQYDDEGFNNDGLLYDNLVITGSPVSAMPSDIYRVTLTPGEELSAALSSETAAESTFLQLISPTGEVVSVGSGGWLDASGAIRGFTATTGGDYYIRVLGMEGPYTLTVTRNAGFTPEPTDTGDVIHLGPSGKAVGYYDDDPTDPAYTDNYSFYADAGDDLTLRTTTPDIGLLPSANGLDSYLELYDPDGLLVAQADGGGDGLNALINFTAQQAGQYTVKLCHADAPPGGTYTKGPYLLHVTGNTGIAPPLQVLSTSLDSDGYINTETHDVTVNFSGPVDINTVTASGLTANGTPADAFTVVDNDSITFSFSAGLQQGINTVMLAEGSVLGLDGSPVAAFTQEVTYDTVAPRIISSTISQDDVVEMGHIQLVIVFDEALDATDLDRSDVYLYTSSVKSLNRPYIDQFEYDQASSTLTLGIQGTAEGDYTVRLLDYRFYDLAGNRLDGENPGTPMPPAVSGNGVPGGQFTLDFSVDRTQPDEIATPVRQNLHGSLASLSRNSGYLNHAGDVDTFRFFAQTGQIITAELDPISTLSAPITLTGPGGAVSDGTVGAPTLLTYTHTGPDGMVEWSVQGDPDSATYDLDMYINATVEAALPVGPAPDDNAYELTNAWLNLPGAVRTATVFGTGQPARVSIANNISSQSSFQANFYSLTTPTGDGTLTITALADLDADDEYLTINGENIFVSSAFTTGGSDTGIVTTTLTIPRAQLASMAANSSIIFTITPSGAVDSLSESFVKVELDYPGLAEPQIDTYALELKAGESLTAMLDRWQTTGATLDLIDHATGQAVAIGEPAPGYTHTLQSFVAPTTGRYDLRVHTLRSDDYVLTLLQRAVFDLMADAGNTTALPDDNSTALGLLLSPDGERLFATTSSNPQSGTPGIVELDPDTLEPIGFTPYREGLTTTVNTGFSLAFDGVHLFTISGHSPNLQVLDPDLGVVIDTRDIENLISPYRIGYYGGYLIGFTEPKVNGRVRFIDPDSGRTDHDLSLQPPPDHVAYIALAGAESRSSIFIAVRRASGNFISEIDAQTGDPLNTFMVETNSILDLAYVDGKIILTSGNLQGFPAQLNYISAYDPDTGELLESAAVPVSATPTGIYAYNAIAGDGRIPTAPTDRYSLTLNAGERVTLSTETLFEHTAAAPLNDLDPAIRLLDPNGLEVAFDQNSADDGKNARLTFTATLTGAYTIEVLAESGGGEYLLHADRTPTLTGDLDGDGFVGVADLNLVLGNWNQAVAVGNLAQGDASGDGFVGIEDLNAVLGNWNATLEPPTVEGDLDNDGFVGISDLNIVLGNWNQSVTPGDLTQGDTSNDGFVGIEDLNTVLGDWNAGTPPAVEAIATSAREAAEATNATSAIKNTTPHPTNRRPLRTWPSDEAASKRQYGAHSPAVTAAWSYLNQRSQRVDNAGYMPWSLRQQEEPAVLGLWEQQYWNAEPASPSQ